MKNKSLLFFIKSSRGTEEYAIFKVPINFTKEDIEAKLEWWCSKFGCWDASPNIIKYGAKKINILPKDALDRRWKNLCKKKKQIETEYEILKQMFNVRVD